MIVRVGLTPRDEVATPLGVVIDVLRATSVICQALAGGFASVTCVGEVEEARTLAGDGVMRTLDWTNVDNVASGALVRALGDWESLEAPPVNLLYRSSVRRIPRVRLFMDFVTELFRELDVARGQHLVGTERPHWLGRHYGRASAMLTRNR